MANVLIVEDSADQARMVAGLIEAEGWIAQVASSGLEALERVAAEPPDVVVTDLIMPGINGLQVVDAMREKHPLVPVILMTAFGSGEIALRALRKGAASYVPKRRLQQELVRTIENTLRVAQTRREKQRVLSSMTEAEYRFVLENEDSLIPPLVGFVKDAVRDRLGDDENQLIQLGIALQEALLNAMHHGNLEVDSDIREAGGELYAEQIAKRRTESAYRDRRVHFSARISRTELCCIVRDEGPGFDPTKVPDPTDPENLERVSGRGLYLIFTFMDRVDHNETGNQITLVKQLAAATEGTS